MIAVLHKVQAQYGYLAAAHLDAVAQLMQIPAAKVSGVASFYHYYRLQPRGRFLINVCMGTACYVKGADRVAQKLMDELGIRFGETSTDGVFTLESSRCLGTCGLAPVMMVDNHVHPEVTPDQVPLILEKYPTWPAASRRQWRRGGLCGHCGPSGRAASLLVKHDVRAAAGDFARYIAASAAQQTGCALPARPRTTRPCGRRILPSAQSPALAYSLAAIRLASFSSRTHIG